MSTFNAKIRTVKVEGMLMISVRDIYNILQRADKENFIKILGKELDEAKEPKSPRPIN